MKKFLVLYRMDMGEMKKAMASMNPEDQKKNMAEWGAWMQKHIASFADAGAPAGKNTQVSASGAEQKSNDIGGYSIVQAESQETAVAMLSDSPHLKMPGATADVMELMPMPGM